MSLLERTDDLLFWAATSAGTAMAGGLGWIVRMGFTNQARLDLLEAEMKTRNKAREEDRDRMSNIEDSLRGIHNALMDKSNHGH